MIPSFGQALVLADQSSRARGIFNFRLWSCGRRWFEGSSPMGAGRTGRAGNQFVHGWAVIGSKIARDDEKVFSCLQE